MLVTTLGRQSAILLLSVLCAAGMLYYHLGLFVPRAMEVRAAQGFGGGHSFGADFYPIWLTSRRGLLLRRDPYSAEMTRRIQIGLFGRTLDSGNPGAPAAPAPEDYRAFAYPAFVDLLFWPLALLPFSSVRIGLAVILPAATALNIVLWLRTFRLRVSRVALVSLMLLTLSSYAVLEGAFAEQVGLLVGFLLAASLSALVEGRLLFSGSLLALTLIKPQMTVLIVAYLLLVEFGQWRERWRFVGGFLFVTALLGVSSLLVWPHWIGEWLGVMFGYREYSTPPLVSYLLGNRIGSRLGPFLIGAIVVTAMALAWSMRRASATSTKFAVTISLLLAVTTITLLPGHAVYDHVVLRTRSDPDCPLMARLCSLEPRLSRGAGRDCVGFVLAVDACSGCDCNEAGPLSSIILFSRTHTPYPHRRLDSFRRAGPSWTDDATSNAEKIPGGRNN